MVQSHSLTMPAGMNSAAAGSPAKLEQFDIYTPQPPQFDIYTPQGLASRRVSHSVEASRRSSYMSMNMNWDLTDAWLNASDECVLQESVGQLDACSGEPLEQEVANWRRVSSSRRRSSLLSRLSDVDQELLCSAEGRIIESQEQEGLPMDWSNAGIRKASMVSRISEADMDTERSEQIMELRETLSHDSMLKKVASGDRLCFLEDPDMDIEGDSQAQIDVERSPRARLVAHSWTEAPSGWGANIEIEQVQEECEQSIWGWLVGESDIADTSAAAKEPQQDIESNEEEEDWLPSVWSRIMSNVCVSQKQDELNYLEKLRLEMKAMEKLP